MTTILAEITPGHQQIALVAGGSDPEVTAVAAKKLQTLTPLFSKSDPPGGLVVPATWPAVVQLAETFGAAWHPGPVLQEWIREQVTARTAAPPTLYTPPDGLTPFPWQSTGAAMIAATGAALITDEPGTGKTITAILGLVERASITAQDGPALVICPASVIDSWVDAWRTWAPHVRTVAWRGTPKVRHALAGTADVYVTSYETARTDSPSGKKGVLTQLGAQYVVVDECHLIKNPTSARSQAVRRLTKKATGAVVALSGTPITHHPGDLWASLDAISHDAWPSRERWVKRYCTTLETDYRQEILGLAPHAEEEFRLTLLGQQRRVAKADVLTQLPPKVYSVRTVDLTPTWRKAYDEFEGQMLATLPEGAGELSVMDVLAKVNHLFALASAPADVEITFGPDVSEVTGQPKEHVHLELKAPSWKVDALLEILEEHRTDEGRSPIVAFAPSRQLMMLAGKAATAAGYTVGYVVGEQTPKARTEAVRAFQAGELDLICVTTGAGGVGITLTAARTCVFLQRPWSLVEAMQAEDRCHRIGSERHDSIEVIDIVARNTIDTRVRAVLRERAGQLSDLVQDPRVAAELLGGSTNTDNLERQAS
ncbi:DEAD/DEAH box helicase [Nocardioides sp. 31GB23]|uniref:DEAD/DEAH box helicase n=1 Tax=Nocardioides sp. 31GB23 TaxID=3156065 RepID=UPI0032AE9F95